MATTLATSTAASAEPTYPETTGGVAHTWTNYTNAGGTEGPQIPKYATVQIGCKLRGFRVADGNTWWYRIAQSPWSNNFYVSADVFYNNGQTSGSLAGTPFVDPAVVDCGAPPPPPPPPPPSPSKAILAQGPAAPAGYRYAISLSSFAPNSSVSISCRDSKSPGGFYTFSLTTNGRGEASTENYCYSADGPDHWVVANGIESNHVAWGGGSAGGGGASGGGGGGTTGGGPTNVTPSKQGVASVFFSGTDDANGPLGSGVRISDNDVGYKDWKGNCKPGPAVAQVGQKVDTLAGWSKGRMGPVYFLSAAGDRKATLHTIILYDPGAAAEMSVVEPGFWDRLRFWNSNNPPCDVNYNINQLIASWLKSDPSNRLFVIAGKATIDKESGHDFGGIWKYYIADIWNQPFAGQAFVCYYDGAREPHAGMGHEDTVKYFHSLVESPKSSCPDAPNGFRRSQWHP